MNTDYKVLIKQTDSLVRDVPYMTANLANVSALLYHSLEDVNWAGFYLRDGDQLVLGPFQGNVACVEIPIGKGVCGTAVLKDETQRIPDVHQFDGHIACDAASRSEIVIPIHHRGEVIGVLDIDSPVPGRFTQQDQEGLEAIVFALENSLIQTEQLVRK